MTVNNPTTNYGWILPTEGGSNDTWGTELNEMIADLAGAIDSIDEVITTLQAELDAEEVRLDDLEERTDQLEADAPRPAYARVYLAASESVADVTAENLSWTEDFDKNDCFDSANPTRLTIPSTYDGLFTVRGVVRVPSYSGSDDDAPQWRVRITKNAGAEVISEAKLPHYNDGFEAASGDQTLIAEALVSVVGGDYFELEVYYDRNGGPGSTTRTVLAGQQNTYFELYRHRSPLTSQPPSVGGVFYSSNASSTNSHSINYPLENRQAGDIVIMVFQPRANPTLVNEPSGWTRFASSGAESAVNDVYVYYRRITSAEAGGGSVSGWELNIARVSTGVMYLLKTPHATQDPEAAFGWGTGSGTNVVTITPSWSDDTFYISLGGLSTTQVPTAIPSGWTDADVETPDPDYKRTGTGSGDNGICSVYKTGAGAATSVYESAGAGSPSWSWSSGTSDIGTLIAIRGAALS